MDLVASALGLVGKIILNEIEVVLSCYLKTLYETKVIPESEPFMHTPQKKSLSQNVRSEMSTKCANYI